MSTIVDFPIDKGDYTYAGSGFETEDFVQFNINPDTFSGILFDDGVDYFAADFTVLERELCQPSKWHFLTSSQEQLNDGLDVLALVRYQDLTTEYIPIYDGFYEFTGDLKTISFKDADRGFCIPLQVQVQQQIVSEPSAVIAMVGLCVCFLLGAIVKGGLMKRLFSRRF